MLSWLFIALLAGLTGYFLGRIRLYQLQNSGEAQVRRVIQAICTGPNWHLMNNITLPVNDGTTQIDHILVSRFGIFVIETKNYSGWLFGSAKAAEWTQVIYKKKSRFQNPIRQNYKHVKAVQALCDFLPAGIIESVVVFTGDAEFKSSRPEGVFTLTELSNALRSLRNEVISEKTLHYCVGRIECQRLALTQKTDVEHRHYLQRKFGNFS